jgi:hypothetical protein
LLLVSRQITANGGGGGKKKKNVSATSGAAAKRRRINVAPAALARIRHRLNGDRNGRK